MHYLEIKTKKPLEELKVEVLQLELDTHEPVPSIALKYTPEL
jgi:hypothetical protein|tara:strand:- start:226 stop:351 length:126 start_codon:yes stop_codon:yes gene_type:complete